MSKKGIELIGITEDIGDLIYKLEPDNDFYSDIPIVYYVSGNKEIDKFLNGNKFYELGLVLQLYSYENAIIFSFVHRNDARIYNFTFTKFLFGINKSKIIRYEIVEENEFDFVDTNFFLNTFKKGVGGILLTGVSTLVEKNLKIKTYTAKGELIRLFFLNNNNEEECITTYVESNISNRYRYFLSRFFNNRKSVKSKRKKDEGCFIATACYGGYDTEEVLVFRNFRDKTLKKNLFGRYFIRLYYFFSPKFLILFKNNQSLLKFIRINILDKIYMILKK